MIARDVAVIIPPNTHVRACCCDPRPLRWLAQGEDAEAEGQGRHDDRRNRNLAPSRVASIKLAPSSSLAWQIRL